MDRGPRATDRTRVWLWMSAGSVQRAVLASLLSWCWWGVSGLHCLKVDGPSDPLQEKTCQGEERGAFDGRTSSGRLTAKPFSAWPTSAWRKYSLQAASTDRCPRNSLPSTRTVTSHRISCFRWSLRQRRMLAQ